MKNCYETRCAVISIYPFPDGMAPTNRIIAYSKGMVESGAKVDLFIPFPTDNYNQRTTFIKVGVFDGINYKYTSGRVKSKYKLLRAFAVVLGFRKAKGYITSCINIYRIHREKKYSCLIISTDSIPPLIVYSVFSKLNRIKSIFIFDEYPIPIRHKLKTKIPKWKKVLYKKVLVNVDGYISISEELKKYYNKICTKPTYVLPVIVDFSRFNSSNSSKLNLKFNQKYICYMGNMELAKDDVDNIIKAFALISQKYSDVYLHLYGNPSKEERSYLDDLINTLSLDDRTFIKGRVSSDKVPEILVNAYILVSSQPDTVRASGGFPTKLGEYLAAEVPALLTDVGENSKYVSDGEHLYFSEPVNPKAYAEKLTYIINNYEQAKSVACKGKKYLLNNYSHTQKGKELVEFIKSL